MSTTLHILADYPAYIVFDGKQANFTLDNNKGYCRTSSAEIMVRGLSKRYPDRFLNSFTIGHDEEGGYWAFGNGATLTSSPRGKGIVFGFDLGDTIKIEGSLFTIEPAPNSNVKLVPVA